MTTEPKVCKYCGKEYKNISMHEKYCKINSESMKSNSSDVPKQKKPSFLRRIIGSFKRKENVETEVVNTPDLLIKDLPKWSIKERRPSKLFNRGKDFIQVVLISEVFEPKVFWAEYDGILIRTKNRAYKPPRDVRGEIFFWHVDKKEPLVDLAKADEDTAEDSFHELQMFNMAYSVGRQAGMNDWTQKMSLMLILIIIALVAEVAVGLFMFNSFKAINNNIEALRTLIETYITTRP